VILVRTDRPSLTPYATIVSKLVYSPSPAAVDTVMVDGEFLVRGGELQRWSLPDLLEAANRLADEMLGEAGLTDIVRQRTSLSWNPTRAAAG
jgi:5-methylthioadenosine/S-adenosylhomocysteine deaminase